MMVSSGSTAPMSSSAAAAAGSSSFSAANKMMTFYNESEALSSTTSQNRPGSKNIDSLLRFFQSDYFKSEIFYLMHYLYHDERPGIQDYLVNQLYEKSDVEVDFYLCQLVQICITRLSAKETTKSAQSLSKFLVWKAKSSVHFALKIHWLAISVFEEREQTKALKIAGDTLIDQVERAVVNAHLDTFKKGPTASSSATSIRKTSSETLSDNLNAAPGAPAAGTSILTYLRSLKRDARGGFLELDEAAPNVYAGDQLSDSIPRIEEQPKILTVNYWNTQLAFSTFLLSLSDYVIRCEDRDLAIQKPLNLLNVWLLERRCFAATALSEFQMIGLHVPLHGWDTRLQLLKVHAHDCRVFSTKTRAPFLLICEFGDLDEELDDEETKQHISGRDLVYQEMQTLFDDFSSDTMEKLLQKISLPEWVAKVYQRDDTPEADEVDYVSDTELEILNPGFTSSFGGAPGAMSHESSTELLQLTSDEVVGGAGTAAATKMNPLGAQAGTSNIKPTSSAAAASTTSGPTTSAAATAQTAAMKVVLAAAAEEASIGDDIYDEDLTSSELLALQHQPQGQNQIASNEGGVTSTVGNSTDGTMQEGVGAKFDAVDTALGDDNAGTEAAPLPGVQPEPSSLGSQQANDITTVLQVGTAPASSSSSVVPVAAPSLGGAVTASSADGAAGAKTATSATGTTEQETGQVVMAHTLSAPPGKNAGDRNAAGGAPSEVDPPQGQNHDRIGGVNAQASPAADDETSPMAGGARNKNLQGGGSAASNSLPSKPSGLMNNNIGATRTSGTTTSTSKNILSPQQQDPHYFEPPLRASKSLPVSFGKDPDKFDFDSAFSSVFLDEANTTGSTNYANTISGCGEAELRAIRAGMAVSNNQNGFAPYKKLLHRKLQAAKFRKKIWSEPWDNKKKRIEQTSKYAKLKSWSLRSIIVKSGDDVRQEVLASQLISQFKWIFDQAPGLNLYLRPIEVLITGARSGFIEMVPDSISIDRLKRKFPDKSLSEVFNTAFGDRLLQAKRAFTESTAAYSLVCYFLQVRDRHNGNMLLDRNGHIIHIDFGFMLSNSPGNIAFETSPFKLTQEFLDIMDGEESEQYQYFCTLLIRGFLEARRHIERISTLIQSLANSNLPCFSGKPCSLIITELEERFFRGIPDDACIEQIHHLIDNSVNNWRTRQYDNYQRITNGIL
ncbi:unnamed protein product [Amoebophrya sp. A120]|nr:unnamed protein product [Amoebophrya sp. A120]|eukprot:GSA120T00007341001.1